MPPSAVTAIPTNLYEKGALTPNVCHRPPIASNRKLLGTMPLDINFTVREEASRNEQLERRRLVVAQQLAVEAWLTDWLEDAAR